MTQELLRQKETGDAAECCGDKCLVLKKMIKNEMMQSFQKQQVANLQMKEALARELADMELPELIVHQILNIKN